jgi:tRNA(fMet)-specific endonuclease VapC
MSGEYLLDTNVVIGLLALGCDTDVARSYGEVKNAPCVKGRPIPENDIWISAIALRHGLTLATRDVHFGEVAGLRTAAW